MAHFLVYFANTFILDKIAKQMTWKLHKKHSNDYYFVFWNYQMFGFKFFLLWRRGEEDGWVLIRKCEIFDHPKVSFEAAVEAFWKCSNNFHIRQSVTSPTRKIPPTVLLQILYHIQQHLNKIKIGAKITPRNKELVGHYNSNIWNYWDSWKTSRAAIWASNQTNEWEK